MSSISFFDRKILDPHSSVPKSSPKPRSKIVRILNIFSLWPLSYIGVAFYASFMVNRELAAIRQAGEPVTLADFKPIPVADNAAPLYHKAVALLNLSATDKLMLRGRLPNGRPAESPDPRWSGFFNKHEKSLQLVYAAAALPASSGISKSDSGSQIGLQDNYADARRLAPILAAHACRSVRQGHRAQAMTDVHALFNMSRQLECEPSYIAFLSAQGLTRRAQHTLGFVVKNMPITVAPARKLQRTLPRTKWDTFVVFAFQGERVSDIAMYDDFPRIAENVDLASKLSRHGVRVFVTPWLKFDELGTLRLWRPNLAALTTHGIVGFTDTGRQLEKVAKNPSIYSLNRLETMGRLFSDSGPRPKDIFVLQHEQEIALALECYRTLHGSYPETLAQAQQIWGSPLPHDLYSGKPFQYHRSGTEYLLYSIGANRRDDRGVHKWGKDTKDVKDDIAWRLSGMD